VICEMYIDDCIVFGSDMNEFVDRLRQVIVKALKCHFGTPKLNMLIR
jgi:hypothetical protein